MYKPCPYTSIYPASLKEQVYLYLVGSLREYHSDRANYLSPNQEEHHLFGEFQRPESEFGFKGFFKQPAALTPWEDVEILCFQINMYDERGRSWYHPSLHKFINQRNYEPTGLSLRDLMDYTLPAQKFEATKHDIDRAESVLFTAFRDMVQLDAHTAHAWASEYLSSTDDFNYEDPYNSQNVQDAVRWAIAKNKGS